MYIHADIFCLTLPCRTFFLFFVKQATQQAACRQQLAEAERQHEARCHELEERGWQMETFGRGHFWMQPIFWGIKEYKTNLAGNFAGFPCIVRVDNLMTPVSVWVVWLVKMEFHQLEGMDAARRESEEQEMKYLQKLQAAERSRDEAHEVLLEIISV